MVGAATGACLDAGGSNLLSSRPDGAKPEPFSFRN